MDSVRMWSQIFSRKSKEKNGALRSAVALSNGVGPEARSERWVPSILVFGHVTRSWSKDNQIPVFTEEEIASKGKPFGKWLRTREVREKKLSRSFIPQKSDLRHLDFIFSMLDLQEEEQSRMIWKLQIEQKNCIDRMSGNAGSELLCWRKPISQSIEIKWLSLENPYGSSQIFDRGILHFARNILRIPILKYSNSAVYPGQFFVKWFYHRIDDFESMLAFARKRLRKPTRPTVVDIHSNRRWAWKVSSVANGIFFTNSVPERMSQNSSGKRFRSNEKSVFIPNPIRKYQIQGNRKAYRPPIFWVAPAVSRSHKHLCQFPIKANCHTSADKQIYHQPNIW